MAVARKPRQRPPPTMGVLSSPKLATPTPPKKIAQYPPKSATPAPPKEISWRHRMARSRKRRRYCLKSHPYYYHFLFLRRCDFWKLNTPHNCSIDGNMYREPKASVRKNDVDGIGGKRAFFQRKPFSFYRTAGMAHRVFFLLQKI